MAHRPVACLGCGAQLPTRTRCGRPQWYCTPRCRDRTRRAKNRDERLQVERRAGEKRRAKPGFRERQRAAASGRNYERYKTSDTTRTCEICGVQFCNLFGRHSWLTLCSDECARQKELRKRIRNEKARRHRKRGANSEVVDPFKVFDRDGWRCQLCGARTPKQLRGSCEDRAPELDHILPLSQGGAHSYSNTQHAMRLPQV